METCETCKWWELRNGITGECTRVSQYVSAVTVPEDARGDEWMLTPKWFGCKQGEKKEA